MYHKFADTDTLENMKQVSRVIIKHNCTKHESAELKAMRLEDKVMRKKKPVCNYNCYCKLIAHVNSQQLDPLLFNICKTNSKAYSFTYEAGGSDPGCAILWVEKN